MLSVLKSLGKLKGKMSGRLGRMQERKPRLRIEVGCRPGITRDLISKLRMIVISVCSKWNSAFKMQGIHLFYLRALHYPSSVCTLNVVGFNSCFSTNCPLSSCHLH